MSSAVPTGFVARSPLLVANSQKNHPETAEKSENSNTKVRKGSTLFNQNKDRKFETYQISRRLQTQNYSNDRSPPDPSTVSLADRLRTQKYLTVEAPPLVAINIDFMKNPGSNQNACFLHQPSLSEPSRPEILRQHFTTLEQNENRGSPFPNRLRSAQK